MLINPKRGGISRSLHGTGHFRLAPQSRQAAAGKSPASPEPRTGGGGQGDRRRDVCAVGQATGDPTATGGLKNQLHRKRRKWMNKGMGMDGFQEIMPMGDDDSLITVDDLNDSLSPECLLNEQMKDILIFDDLEIPPPEEIG